ncbi:helix-turn-helix transcriptional regulator [Candidatus Cyanaurora vandensis]|uniref:helix-turn-helix transcriptional regulator n=1 Tax=Candidatus Cyanaurora vandensis TaxID=2714958 RepID=UPI00257B17FB|nr:helix-turn-helix transcriptional regulator [Candidatus Cyanaurora vandensis]
MSKIADLRKRVGFTQRQLSDVVGVTESTVRNWEAGRNGLDLFVTVARLCKALNCTPDELVAMIDPVKGELSTNRSSDAQ